ncbi:DUF6380 family protein [Streptomyces paradoxus]|uniref:DUF6380 family protein n=1 Tax=Streptomyces paradoxus TaxID=66375 RepID=UPI0036312813
MTNGPVQGDTTDDRTRSGLCCRAAAESTLPRAPQARAEVEPVGFPVRRRGRVWVAGHESDAEPARGKGEPVFSPVHLRGCAAAVGGVARVGRGCDAPPGRAVGDKRRATLRCGAASLTETTGRAPIERHGRRAGKGA